MNTNYAGFWLRFVAIIIDSLIIGCLNFLIIVPILAAIGIGAATSVSDMAVDDPAEAAGMIGAMMALFGTAYIALLVLQVLYFTLMESSKYQATIGKLALGLKVTDMNGEKLDFAKALIRNLCKYISSMILMIGYIMAGFTDKKQALHDIIAGTLVVKK